EHAARALVRRQRGRRACHGRSGACARGRRGVWVTDQPGSQDIPDEDDIVGDSSATAVAESTAHVADGAALTGPDGEPVDADTGDGDTGAVTGEHALAAPAAAAEHAPNPESGEPTDPAGEARHATGADARSSGGNRQRDAAV